LREVRSHRGRLPCTSCGREESRTKLSECMGCLRKFHVNCLVRVKRREKTVKRTGPCKGYWICPECLAKEPPGRVVVLSQPRSNQAHQAVEALP